MWYMQAIHKANWWIWEAKQSNWRVKMIIEIGRVKDAEIRIRWVNSHGRNEQIRYLWWVKEMLGVDGWSIF